MSEHETLLHHILTLQKAMISLQSIVFEMRNERLSAGLAKNNTAAASAANPYVGNYQ